MVILGAIFAFIWGYYANWPEMNCCWNWNGLHRGGIEKILRSEFLFQYIWINKYSPLLKLTTPSYLRAWYQSAHSRSGIKRLLQLSAIMQSASDTLFSREKGAASLARHICQYVRKRIRTKNLIFVRLHLLRLHDIRSSGAKWCDKFEGKGNFTT